MTFRDMTSQEMLATTRPWVTPGHPAYMALQARPLTAAMMPEVTAAHQDLEQAAGRPIDDTLRALIDQTQAKDERHDDLVRCLHSRLSAEVAHAPSPLLAEPFIALQEAILPDGTALVQRSYAHEVGHAATVAAQITADQRALLQTIPMATGTLDDVVNEYLAVATELGDLEHQRRMLGDIRPGRGSALKARNRWTRSVTLVMAAAPVLGDADVEIAELVQAVEQAKSQALQRRLRRIANGGDADGDGDGDGANEGDADGNDGGPADGAVLEQGELLPGAEGERAALAERERAPGAERQPARATG